MIKYICQSFTQYDGFAGGKERQFQLIFSVRSFSRQFRVISWKKNMLVLPNLEVNSIELPYGICQTICFVRTLEPLSH